MNPPTNVMTNAATNIVMPESTEHSDKPERTSIVEFKNAKLLFKQKALSFEKMSETMQEIVKFREMIEQRIERKDITLSTIPEAHMPLIAKLVHESDKTLQALSKHVHRELLPIQDDDDDGPNTATSALELEAVEKAIKLVANRNDYGLDSIGEGKVPAALHIWRWEVKDERLEWLPKATKEKAEARLAERIQAKKDLKTLFDALSADDRGAVLGSRNTGKSSLKTKPNNSTSEEKRVIDSDNIDAKFPQGKKRQKNSQENGGAEETSADGTPKGPGRPKKSVDPEKAAKEKEKQEKKAAKAEREKKEQEAREKSRSIMANFFGKGKVPAVQRSISIPSDELGAPGPSSVHSEFERAFRPFTVKKDAELAPINWFQHVRKHPNSAGVDVIVLDDDEDEVKTEPPGDVEMIDVFDDQNLGQLTAQERLRGSLASLPPTLYRPRRQRLPATHLKTHMRHSVRAVMAQLTEAEIAGDDAAVRSLLALLRNRAQIPAKVLVFEEDARPGYFGTWTRNSREIGPRAPFARDVVALDYTCDSGAEWDDEDGADADDVIEDAEDDEPADEIDSDADSWLVDDDDIEPGTPIEDRDSSPDLTLLDTPLPPAPKRKVTTEEPKVGKKRKVVVPLVPFSKGPCWESRIGRCEYEPFRAYRIELFNDTPYPIDPFAFVSQPVDEPVQPPITGKPDPTAAFAVPALPTRITAASDSTLPSEPTAASRKRAPAPPKTTFPEAHVPLLVETIGRLETGSLTYIVETVHRELQGARVKKNAIEVKLREIGEKCRERKIWVVRADVSRAGSSGVPDP